MLFNLLTFIGCAAHAPQPELSFVPEPQPVIQEKYEPAGMPCMDVIVFYYEAAECTTVESHGYPNEDMGAIFHCSSMNSVGTKTAEIAGTPFLLRTHDLTAPEPPNSILFCMDPWFEVWAYVGE